MPLHKDGYKIRMCADCAGAFEYNPENHSRTPDTHNEIGENFPTMYRE